MPTKTKDPDSITIPEDLTTLGDADLGELHDQAVAAFQSMMPEDGAAPDDDTLTALNVLAEGITAVKAQIAERDHAALARSSAAKELADKVLAAGDVAQEVIAEEEGTDEPEGSADDTAEGEVPQMVASSRRPININLAGLRGDRPAPVEEAPVDKPKTVGYAAQGAAGFDVGTPLTIADMAASINSRLGGFNAASYEASEKRGHHQSERFTIAKLRRDFDERAVVQTEDPSAAIKFASDEGNTPQGSLTASGGWCAPSETMYELVNISEAENLISVPEIQINRGGVRHTLGPDYRAVYAATGFCYTEAQDITGTYGAGNVKPPTTVPCPGFTDVRLGYCGVIIGAGLLQQRGYPEVIEDYIAKTLTGHAHRVSASVINSMVSQSTAIAFAGLQAGATAPLLSAIDLQAAHYRALNRMADTATLEIVLPTWVKALVRNDLARRLGLADFEVSDARLAGWFSNRGVKAQYVVDWQDISTTQASGFLSAPTGVSFLLYASGTFIKGVTDSLTFENIYDSVLLGTNNYTALFTEDPYLVLKRNWDARVVTVPVTADGATHVGIDIKPDGTV